MFSPSYQGLTTPVSLPPQYHACTKKQPRLTRGCFLDSHTEILNVFNTYTPALYPSLHLSSSPPSSLLSYWWQALPGRGEYLCLGIQSHILAPTRNPLPHYNLVLVCIRIPQSEPHIRISLLESSDTSTPARTLSSRCTPNLSHTRTPAAEPHSRIVQHSDGTPLYTRQWRQRRALHMRYRKSFLWW